MSVRAGGAEDMFLDVKDLAVRKVRIRNPSIEKRLWVLLNDDLGLLTIVVSPSDRID